MNEKQIINKTVIYNIMQFNMVIKYFVMTVMTKGQNNKRTIQ